jgi:uncharacterized protein with HEPN domain
MMINAILRNFEITGENSKKIPERIKYSEILWKKGMV